MSSGSLKIQEADPLSESVPRKDRFLFCPKSHCH